MCALLSIVGTLLRVPRPGNLLSAVDKSWVAAMVLNRDMGQIMRLPSPGKLPAAALGALPAPHAPLVVADLGHQTGLPDAQRQHALLCLAAAPGGCRWSCRCPCSTSEPHCKGRGRTTPSPGRRMPSGGCRWRTWRPPMLWGKRTWDGWGSWRAQGFAPVCGWNRGVCIGSRSLRTGSCGGNPWEPLALGSSGTTCGSWAPWPGTEVLARGHPASICGVRRGDDRTPHAGTGCMAGGPAGGPRQHVAA